MSLILSQFFSLKEVFFFEQLYFLSHGKIVLGLNLVILAFFADSFNVNLKIFIFLFQFLKFLEHKELVF